MGEPGQGAGRRGIRWWPAAAVLVAGAALVAWARTRGAWPYQQRNLLTLGVAGAAVVLLACWWAVLSGAPRRLRLLVPCCLLGAAALGAGLFRLRGVTGDLVPILEFRWARPAHAAPGPAAAPLAPAADAGLAGGFPQFRGPGRDGVLAGPRLRPDWAACPPATLWRRPVGAAWSGFAVAAGLAITQEQRGNDECVVAYQLATGREAWRHAEAARYRTTMAGEGPRATPTIAGERVFAMGATGRLSCLALATGGRLWSRDVVAGAGARVPRWGCAGSPLVAGGLVVVHGGEQAGRSLFAYRMADGAPAWAGGGRDPGYSSPGLATLAGVPQVLAFNDRSVSGHDPATGATLWERPWGNGNAVCASPVAIDGNRVVFSSGYGVGAELLEITRDADGQCAARLVWKSTRMKAKFAHVFARDGFLYGLDDGVFACVSLADGTQRWRGGRYGHGQGLLIGGDYLLMAESGELVLLRPTPDAPNELARHRVFRAKTWNPIALAGDLLLLRNDREAACLHLPALP